MENLTTRPHQFQFHKGTIKTRQLPSEKLLMLNFNSIKVRLKRASDVNLKAKLSVFQFHKGTIKTVIIAENVKGLLLFQFHKGTIKTRNQ